MHDFKTVVPHTHDPAPYFEQFFTMWPRYAATYTTNVQFRKSVTKIQSY